MTSVPISSVYNDGYIAELYDSYRRDPASVDESWRQFFRFAESLAPAAPPASAAAAAPASSAADASAAGTTVAADPAYLRKVAGASSLVEAIREHGHLAVAIDPLGSAPPGAPELTPEFHGIAEDDLRLVPAIALGFDVGTAADVVAHLRKVYCSNLGAEFLHLGDYEEREWFRDVLEREALPRTLSDDDKRAVLRRLSEVDGLERFIGRAWVNMKRFSVEGTDALVPMLDAAIDEAGKVGAREVAIAMAHRGRINVLAHVLGKPVETIFSEFDGKHASDDAESETGDVKYHLGFRGTRETPAGPVAVQLVPNPSHLEVVNPVLAGVVRARQRAEGNPAERDEASVVAVVVHGDAAFPGEGVVAETFNMSRLNGYRVGGTVHIIANNQVGFTTDPVDARSTRYASDLAKGFDVPVMHVNGDDAEACVVAMRLALAYRARFHKDVVVDLVGYRRHGHNEGDEPTFTQPALYAAIKAHPTPRQVWGERLVREGIATTEEVQAAEREVATSLEAVYDRMKRGDATAPEHRPSKEQAAATPAPVETAVPAERLGALNEGVLAWPEGFSVHTRLGKQLERRREALRDGDAPAIDWGHAESLAFATLLADGVSVRLSGQDVERGTFSHRHAVLHDVKTGETFVALRALPESRAAFEIYNSPLSETSVLGFEYGFSVAADDALTLWEAQFGDFVNVAQPVIDQFIAADRAKWGQDSGVVLLLPHGYEGQGPEHSSARLERFLQLCAEQNMRVAYPSTPAQYFHILRRQATSSPRRPLVLMQPKSLLRLPQAASRLADLAGGGFQPVIDDPRMAAGRREEVRRLVLCTGKVYYDLAAGTKSTDGSRAIEPGPQVALVRVEELYPFPHEEVARVVDAYPALEEVVWAQEEPRNMGAWGYIAPRLRAATGNLMRITYVGRQERASPAEGYLAVHHAEQSRIVGEALEVPQDRRGPRRPQMARTTAGG